jgi:hypothetical protein
MIYSTICGASSHAGARRPQSRFGHVLLIGGARGYAAQSRSPPAPRCAGRGIGNR